MSKKSERTNEGVEPPPKPGDQSKDAGQAGAQEDYGFYFFPEREGRNKQSGLVIGDLAYFSDTNIRRACPWTPLNVSHLGARIILSVVLKSNAEPMVKLLMTAMKSHGCNFDLSRHVSCEDCRGNVNGGFDPTTNQIVVCQNTTRSQRQCCSVLAHEMLHMFDYCRAKLDFTKLEHVACTEIRAACFNHCSFLSALTQGDAGITKIKQTHQDCVKRKALMSILTTRDVPIEEAQAVVDRVFTRCYNDLEPFGRVPRRKSRDPHRMLVEAALYGYADS